MTFEEWWKGSGMVRGEPIFRNCWNTALEAAAKACEDQNSFDPDDPGETYSGLVRALKT